MTLTTAHRLGRNGTLKNWEPESRDCMVWGEGGGGKGLPALLGERYKVFGETRCLRVQSRKNVNTNWAGSFEKYVSTNLADYIVSSQATSIMFYNNQLL